MIIDEITGNKKIKNEAPAVDLDAPVELAEEKSAKKRNVFGRK